MANKCKRGILISKTPYEKRIAIMEDGELVELVVEGVSSNRVLGNIYKGVVLVREFPAHNRANEPRKEYQGK